MADGCPWVWTQRQSCCHNSGCWCYYFLFAVDYLYACCLKYEILNWNPALFHQALLRHSSITREPRVSILFVCVCLFLNTERLAGLCLVPGCFSVSRVEHIPTQLPALGPGCVHTSRLEHIRTRLPAGEWKWGRHCGSGMDLSIRIYLPVRPSLSVYTILVFLFIHPSINLSMYVYTIPVCLFILPSTCLCLSILYLSACSSILPSTCLCLSIPVCLFILSFHLPVYVYTIPVYLSMSVYTIPVCLSVHLCIHAPICLIYVNQTAVDLMLLIIQIHVCENMCKYQIWTIQTQPTIVNISLRETHDVDGNFWLWTLNTVQCSHDCIHIGNLITVHLCGSYKSWYSNAHDSRAYWSVVLRWSVVPFPWLGFQKLLPDVVATLAQT